MNHLETIRGTMLARTDAPVRAQGQLWAIVLAGGEGMRLRPLMRRIYGDERPKQYAALFGPRSMLRQTLDRVSLGISQARTVVVTSRRHAKHMTEESAAAPAAVVLAQPGDRGTAAGVLFPAHWISWQDPEATVAVFPSDHFILEEQLFMGHVAEVAALVSRDPRWLVLLGARPTGPEVQYGWIEPGAPLDWVVAGSLRRVRRFWEKPTIETARACLARGCLWNTLVVVAKVSTLIEAGQQLLPNLHDRLARIAPFVDTEDEDWAVQQAYALAPTANFSRSILEPCPPVLTVSTLPALTWGDLGTPDRVFEALRHVGLSPPWLSEGLGG